MRASLLLLLVCAACTEVDPSTNEAAPYACIARETVTCGCRDGAAGTQICLEDGGGYSACVCEASDAGDASDVADAAGD